MEVVVAAVPNLLLDPDTSESAMTVTPVTAVAMATMAAVSTVPAMATVTAAEMNIDAVRLGGGLEGHESDCKRCCCEDCLSKHIYVSIWYRG